MELKDIFNTIFGRNPTTQVSTNPPEPEFGGNRKTIPSDEGGFGALPKKTLRDLGLDDNQLKTLSMYDLMDRLIDAHPDVSFALWDFIRLGSTEYSIKVEKLGSGTQWTQAEKELKEFFQRLHMPNLVAFDRGKTLENILPQAFISVLCRGALCGELVLTPDQKDASFIAIVDPATIEFELKSGRYVPMQDDVSLDIPTFLYEAMDPHIDDVYGRSPFMSALSIVLFQMQALNDIKAVVHNQGYPRLDITVIEELVMKRIPLNIRNDDKKKQEWLNSRLREITDMYNNLNPSDALVHFDGVKVGQAGGGNAMIDPQKLMHVIDSLVMSGLKTLSTVMGRRSTGNTESFAKMEIKLYTAGVRGVQECIERFLSRMLTLLLNIRGKQGIVTFKFKPIEIRSDLEQEQFLSTKLNNIATMYDRGWISQEEAAMRAVGHAPDQPEPRVQDSKVRNADGGESNPATDTNPDAGGGEE